MPAQQQHTSYTGYTSATNGPISPGQCVVLDASGDYYNVSSSAARATAGRRSSGIAITGCAGTAQDRAFELQCVGEIDTAITSLGAGTSSVIRVSAAGMLERAPSYSSSDDVVGFCDADGTAHVCFPLAGLGMALGAASAAAPTNSVQAANADGSFRGAAHASISTDGYIEHAADRTGGAAQSGDDRYSKTSSARVRNANGDGDVAVWTHSSLSSTYDVLTYGSAADATRPEELLARSSVFIGLQTLTEAANVTTSLGIVGPGSPFASGSATTSRFVRVFPNLVLDGFNRNILTSDPTNGARGILLLAGITTNPSAAPSAACFFRSNASNYHPEVLLPGDDPVTGWRDLLAGGTETTVNVTSTSPGDIAITSATRVVNLNASGTCIPTGFTAPTTPAAGVLVVTNNSSSAAFINQDSGATAANGIKVSGSNTYVQIPQYASVVFAYDYNASRWIPDLGAVLSSS